MSSTQPTRIATNKLKTNPNNPRTIREDKMGKLQASIAQDPDFLSLRPLIVNRNLEVLAGNQRLRACVNLGWDKVPCIIVDYDEEKQRRVMIKDNISAGEWDWEMLGNEGDPEELQGWGLDIPWEKPTEDKPNEPKPCKHCDRMIP